MARRQLGENRIFSKKSDLTSEIFRNKLCSVVHLYHGYTQHSHFGMEDFNCVRKVIFSVSRWYMNWSKKGLFFKKNDPRGEMTPNNFCSRVPLYDTYLP